MHIEALIAGPNDCICNECLDLCNEIIEEEAEEGDGEGPDFDRPMGLGLDRGPVITGIHIGDIRARRITAVTQKASTGRQRSLFMSSRSPNSPNSRLG
jgi:ATP-dependent Clp protease ATP-binding subunit ClpX